MVCRVTSFVRIDSQYLAAVTTQHPCPSDPEKKKKAYMQGMGKKGWVIGHVHLWQGLDEHPNAAQWPGLARGEVEHDLLLSRMNSQLESCPASRNRCIRSTLGSRRLSCTW